MLTWQETEEHVRRIYGSLADRILRETRDPRFLNPIVYVSLQDGVVVNRWEEFCKRPWSLAEPEPGSLTEYYLAIGILERVGFEVQFARRRDGVDAAASLD